ncbi:MAG: MYXO-CTERM sorting domain-containing protein [Deltaproteobacteria bacterium]|nr:MYXO-CTERM sorting domain-containing protein [Deltaproteobacteria bacterium]
MSLAFILSMGACGGFGGCGACGAAGPLPGGILPPNQTVEGGAQIRVTPQGFNKLTSILPGAFNQAISGGFCIPHGSTGYTLGTGADWCDQNNGSCAPGCQVNATINPGGLALSVTNQNTLHVVVSTSISTSVHLSGSAVFVPVSCTLNASSNNTGASVDIALGVRADNGELDIHVANVNSFHLGMTFSGCSLLSDVANLVTDLIDAVGGSFIASLLTPAIDSLIQGLLPHPLGIAGTMDIGKLLAGVSPGTTASMEARLVPGGYANLVGNGLSLGMITGLNSDEDPATRSGMRPDGVPYASEPQRCVPPLPISDFGAAPYSLPSVARSAEGGNTFALNVADKFNGQPDPTNTDIAMGVSQTTLDLFGHHAVTSGMMCLGVGTSFIKQLNVGTIGILVPSLADLTDDSGKNPLLLVTRPQRDLTFTIGDNTASSPALTIGISHLEVDFYAFLFERYIRAFTLDLSLNVGVNLTFSQQPGQPATIQPMISGISASQVQLKVLNSEFVKETPQHLEMVLPSVFDLVTPLLGNLPPIQVPNFAGFSLNNLSIQHVMTNQDDFLALYADLGAGAFARQLAAKDSFAAQAVADLDARLGPVAVAAQASSRYVGVKTPAPEKVINYLLEQKDGELPTVTFDVDTHDSQGRALEWTYTINGGMWHEFRPGGKLCITDRAFAWQGKYEIGLISRVVGDYHTTSDVTKYPVVIDSVGPKVFVDKAKVDDDDQVVVPVYDIVDGKDVMIAFGRVGNTEPDTKYVPLAEGTLALATAQHLAGDGKLQVWTKDKTGNTTIALIAPFHGQSGATGCACQTGGAPTSGSLVLFGLVGFGLIGGRRRRKIFRSRTVKNVLFFGLVTLATSLVPACSCDKHPAQSCEMDKDCGPCPKGQLPFCIDNTCVCSDDIPPGRIGPYSDIATGADGSMWVSAYASSHGDLCVAKANGGRIPDVDWEWVDGVPEGPVVVPGSQIRGGIEDDGDDIGMYTSIQVAPDGTPMVSYFDRTHASLKFAAKVGGTWQMHVVDAGTSFDDASGTQVGMYTSLTLRTDDGRPGIAYLAHVPDNNGGHAEVRYAAAQVPVPTSSADWQTWVVDTAPIPNTGTGSADTNIYPLPEGLGLFIESARDPRNNAPVVVYYDRTNGDLKLSRFDPQTGQFATPKVLDGTMGDDGWSPTVAVDDQGVAHVAYVDATADDLKYVVDQPNSATAPTPEIIDDGYRIVGQTVDGLPKPEFHFVGDDAGIVLPPGSQPYVVYQDSTTQEMLLASRDSMGTWTHVSIAGAINPWPGAYGFFASAAVTGMNIVMSTWVIDQPTDDNWVEVFAKPYTIQ